MRFQKFLVLLVIFTSACSLFSGNISGVWHTSDDLFVVHLDVTEEKVYGTYVKTELSREGFPINSFGGSFEGIKASGGYRFSFTSDSGEFGTGSIGLKDSLLVWKMNRSVDSDTEDYIMQEALLSRKE